MYKRQVNQFVFIFNLLIFGAVSAAGIFTAQYHGIGNREGKMYTFRFKLLINTGAALLGIAVLVIFRERLISLFLHQGEANGDLALTLRLSKNYLRIIPVSYTHLSDELLTLFSTYMTDTNQARVRENDNYENFAEMIYNYNEIKENYETDSEEYQNAYMELLYTLWRNKAVSELYEPGSTFKIITTSMAFEENVITPNTVFTCYDPYSVEGTKIHCHKRGGHGTHEYSYMLQQSCNPTLIQVCLLYTSRCV